MYITPITYNHSSFKNTLTTKTDFRTLFCQGCATSIGPPIPLISNPNFPLYCALPLFCKHLHPYQTNPSFISDNFFNHQSAFWLQPNKQACHNSNLSHSNSMQSADCMLNSAKKKSTWKLTENQYVIVFRPWLSVWVHADSKHLAVDTQGKGAQTPLPSELDHQCCSPLSSDDMIMHPNESVSQMMLSPQLCVTLNIL